MSDSTAAPQHPAAPGGPMTVRPVAPGWLVALVLLGGLAAGVYAAKSARAVGRTVVTGRLEAETLRLTAEAESVVAPLVGVGEDVAPGQAVVRVRTRGDDVAVRTKRADRLHEEVARLRSRCELQIAARTAELEAAIHATRMTAARLRGDRFAAEIERVACHDALNDAPPSGPVASVSYEPPADRLRLMVSLEQASARADACEEQCGLCESRLAALTQEREAVARRVREAVGLPAAEAALAAAESAAAACPAGEVIEVTSPGHGRVLRVLAAGEPAGGVLAELANDRVRHVTAAIPAAEAVGLSAGDEVALTFPPSQRRAGRVRHVDPHVGEANAVRVEIEASGVRWPDCPVGCEVRVELP